MENLKKSNENTLIADFEDGGLKMIHLQQFNAYLKISWIKRELSMTVLNTIFTILKFTKNNFCLDLKKKV